MNKTLSVIIPCFNEKDSILKILDQINNVTLIQQIAKEIIIVDDYSTDGTRELLKKLEDQNLQIIYNDRNYGKGYSLKRGIEKATGDYIIIQDADLEYNPQNYNDLLNPMMNSNAPVVYGTRIHNKRYSHLHFYLGGRLVSLITNMLYATHLTDQPTCYKLFKSDLIKNISLQEYRFGFCSEVTAKICNKKIPIIEVPIDYFPRKKEEGKKITWKDGIRAIYVLIKYKKLA